MSGTVGIRRATEADVPFLVGLVAHPAVRPWLSAVRSESAEEIARDVRRAAAEPGTRGVLVVELDGAPVGTLEYEVVNRRSGIAELSGLAVQPDARAGGTARTAVALALDLLLGEMRLHRVEAETYGFNDRAAAFLLSVGFTSEGRRRSAYRREEGWVDGLRFGLLADEWAARPRDRENDG